VFATILGPLPRPSNDADRSDDAAVREVIARQEAAGIEPLTDGRLRDPTRDDFTAAVRDHPGAVTVASWTMAAETTDRAVKQSLSGPYSLARGEAVDDPDRRSRAATELAEALRVEVLALRDSGCPLVEIEEWAAIAIGDDETERRVFRDAHRRLTHGLDGIHLSLSIVGGNADAAGAATILDGDYASFAFDLIAGPDNWRLIADVPGDRGVICGALSPLAGSDDGPELLVWAAHYAGSIGRRGLDRVGLANAPGLDRLAWDVVERKLERLGRAARLASREHREELADALDPRAISTRSAAAGRFVPRPRRARGPDDGPGRPG
jgi:methionine synthase II (cobalamin-independent)